MKNLIIRVARAVYRRIPVALRNQLEAWLAPITKPIFFRGLDWSSPPIIGLRPVSIVIPSYNDLHLLKPLLASIKRTVRNRDYEIIISDDYCQDSNSDQLRKLESTNVRIVFSKHRTGFAGAVNRGLSVAKWDVVLLNSDMIALPGWLDWLEYCAYEVDPKVGMVSPHLIYPTGRIQYGGTYQNRIAAPQWFSHLFQGKPANLKAAQERRYIRANCGAAIYVTRKALDEIGLLDDKYWLGFEDVDWSYRAWGAGHRCMIEPSSRLIHLESATRGLSQGPREYGSMRRFWGKWKAKRPFPLRESQLVIVHSQPNNLSMTLLSKVMADALESQLGLEVDIRVIADGSFADETFVNEFSSRQCRLLALDRESLTTVWLACVGNSAPLAYFDDFESAHVNPNSLFDTALLPPEFDYAVTNRENLANLRASIPWEVSVVCPPVFSPILELHSKQLNEILVVDANDDLLGELNDALQMEFTISDVTMNELLNEISKEQAGGLFGKAILFGSPQSTSTYALYAMALGAVIIYQRSRSVAFDLLDGYNSFSYDPKDLPKLKSQLNYLVENQSALSELINNGMSTTANVNRVFAQQMESLLQISGELHLPEFD